MGAGRSEHEHVSDFSFGMFDSGSLAATTRLRTPHRKQGESCSKAVRKPLQTESRAGILAESGAALRKMGRASRHDLSCVLRFS